MNDEFDPKLENLLDYLKRTRGFDFTAYKRSTLGRRIEKRIQAVGIADFVDYQDYLEVHPGEFDSLFNTILINVTEFFRDPPAWEFMTAEAIPRILEGKGSHEQIRVWSAGCASGEEAYSLTMLFSEALGIDGVRERVKVYATDVDEDALNTARHGRYTEKALEGVPRHLVEKYFQADGQMYDFHQEARRSVIFGRHDLIQDPPISKVDLLACRNTLMYFNTEAQAKVLARFHFALNNGGYLFAGRAEMLLTHANLFAAADLKRRIFTKVTKATLPDRMAVLVQANNLETGEQARARQIHDAAFETGVSAQIILDAKGNFLFANERARILFRLTAKDQGRPFADLEPPPELHRAIEHAYLDLVPAKLRDVDWLNPAGQYEINIRPLRDHLGALLGVSIVMEDVASYRSMQDQLQRARQEVETVTEELQSSNEELETTNEELQSTVEELETTNEELQSTNEELETMNEELQSTNEELQTTNDELRERGNQINTASAFQQSILTSMRNGLAVLDDNGHIMAWNRAAEDLWGLRGDEVMNRTFLGLDIGLPVDQLVAPIRECLAGEESSTTLQATNRRGKAIVCEVLCAPLRSVDGKIEGVILTMEPQGELN
jgi:two-component system CheB/CheR fusion protein